MADENGEELQKMIVRLMGDDKHLQETLEHSKKITIQWKGEMEGAGAAAGETAAAATGISTGLLAGLAAVAAFKLSVDFLKSSWMDTVKEIEAGADATVFFDEETRNAAMSVKEATDEISDALKRLKGDLTEFSAPGLVAVANWLRDIIDLLDDLPTWFTEGGEAVGDKRVKEMLEEQRNRREAIEGDIGGDYLQKQLDAIAALDVKLGNITEEQRLVRDLSAELMEKGVLLTDEMKEQLETLIKQRKEKEKQLELQNEQKRAAEQAAREEQRLIEQANQARQRANEQTAKDFEKRMAQGMKEVEEMIAIRNERSGILAQLEEIRNSGVPISAGAAIEAGSVEGRSLTKFGTAAEKTNELLKDLRRLEERELGFQERTTGAIEAIKDAQPDIIHIA